ncbi:MAG: methionyl-tRNA formyltransferase [Bacteroidales bacterium]|jgi:methionyl-tRNA formyltransferase|nr:methionyl-tRNA formyltransferase [Bacteroidales bacterium]
MKIVYFGTPEIASSQLEAIISAGYEVVAVVTVPDKPAGRGKKIQSSDVKLTALKYNLPILQPVSLKSPEFIEELSSYKADLFIVVAFRMLPEVVWSMPPMGTFNLHASLLPQYRGAAPINHAIINGEKETGLTTFLLDKEIDTGEIIMQEKVVIEDDETAGTLHDKLMYLGNKVVVETIKMIEEGKVHSQSQATIIERDNLQLKPAPKIFKEDCKIDWTKDAKSIYDFIRGLSPYPAAHTQFVSENNETLDIKIFEVALKENKSEDKELYKIKTDGKSYLDVVLGNNNISIKVIQQAGKKAMPIADFLRGTRLDGNWSVK